MEREDELNEWMDMDRRSDTVEMDANNEYRGGSYITRGGRRRWNEGEGGGWRMEDGGWRWGMLRSSTRTTNERNSREEKEEVAVIRGEAQVPHLITAAEQPNEQAKQLAGWLAGTYLV